MVYQYCISTTHQPPSPDLCKYSTIHPSIGRHKQAKARTVLQPKYSPLLSSPPLPSPVFPFPSSPLCPSPTNRLLPRSPSPSSPTLDLSWMRPSPARAAAAVPHETRCNLQTSQRPLSAEPPPFFFALWVERRNLSVGTFICVLFPFFLWSCVFCGTGLYCTELGRFGARGCGFGGFGVLMGSGSVGGCSVMPGTGLAMVVVGF